MFIAKPLFGPGFGINGSSISFHTMIASKNKNSIIKRRRFFCRFHKFFNTVIGISKSLVFGQRFKSVLQQFISCNYRAHKVFIFLRNIKRAVVIGCLYDGKKRFLFFSQYIICLQE